MAIIWLALDCVRSISRISHAYMYMNIYLYRISHIRHQHWIKSRKHIVRVHSPVQNKQLNVNRYSLFPEWICLWRPRALVDAFEMRPFFQHHIVHAPETITIKLPCKLSIVQCPQTKDPTNLFVRTQHMNDAIRTCVYISYVCSQLYI